jgi:hypothetical protein
MEYFIYLLCGTAVVKVIYGFELRDWRDLLKYGVIGTFWPVAVAYYGMRIIMAHQPKYSLWQKRGRRE